MHIEVVNMYISNLDKVMYKVDGIKKEICADENYYIKE